MYEGILIALVPLSIGYLIKLTHPIWIKKINQSLSYIVYVILFLIGSELAQLNALFEQLQYILLSSIILFVCTFGANLLALMAVDIMLPWRGARHVDHATSRAKMILESLQISLALIAGFVCGLIPLSIWQYNEIASKVVLVLLLLLVGIQLRSSNITIRQILMNKIGITTTAIVVISALIGGIITAYILKLPIHIGMAMSSGFGWYSLSGILMTEAQGAMIGSITFLNDIMREMSAVILIPSLIKRFKLASLGICGATSMDFTLPMLQKSGGSMMVPPAIVQGFLLTLIMPFLIPFLNYYF